MARQFFSGNTVEQAVLSAASHYGIDPEKVDYKLRDKKHGFLKTRRRIVIEVDPASPQKSEEETVEVVQQGPGESIAALADRPAKSRARKDRSPSGDEASDSVADEESEESVSETETVDEGDDAFEDRADDAAVDEHDESRGDDSDDHDSGDHEPIDEHETDDDEDIDDEDDEDGDEEDGDEDGDWDEDEESDDDEEEWDDDEDDEDDEEEWDDDLEEGEDRDALAFERAMDRLLDFLDLDLEFEIQRRDDLFEIELSGDDAEIVTGDEGKVLEAMEHLLPRLVRGYVGHGLPCKVDCEGFRAARQQDLLDLADEAAAAVREAGRGLMLEPMNPADRRVIHLALADDPEVLTESEGDGYLKRVRILPAEEREG